MIYPHHLDFMEEAKKAFESNPRFETYRNTAGNLLALRYGMDRNCIAIHEIGEEIAFFAEVMEKAPELVVDVPKENKLTADRPFNVRKELLARSNEWVGAYRDTNDEWIKVGFDLFEMSVVETRFKNKVNPVFSRSGVLLASGELIDKCIPIEDVPKGASL